MQKYSKAIAAIIGGILTALVSLGFIEPMLADQINEATAQIVSVVIMIIGTGLFVERAPANKG